MLNKGINQKQNPLNIILAIASQNKDKSDFELALKLINDYPHIPEFQKNSDVLRRAISIILEYSRMRKKTEKEIVIEMFPKYSKRYPKESVKSIANKLKFSLGLKSRIETIRHYIIDNNSYGE